MRFKKTLCVLSSVLTMSLCLGGVTEAKSMQDVFVDILNTNPGKPVRKYIHKLQLYLEDRAPKTKSTLTELDPVSREKRKDSVAFGLFCCICSRKNWVNYIRYAAERRNADEREEDIEVLESIFPGSMDGPDGLKYLCDKLGISLCDVTMSPEIRAEMVDFIEKSPLLETEERADDYYLRPQSKDMGEERFQKESMELEVTDTEGESVPSQYSQKKSKKERKKQERARKKQERVKVKSSKRWRNKTNCLAAVRYNSMKDDCLREDN